MHLSPPQRSRPSKFIPRIKPIALHNLSPSPSRPKIPTSQTNINKPSPLVALQPDSKSTPPQTTVKIASFIRRFFSGTSPTSSAAMVSAKEKAQKIIDENGVVVFSKSYCPYCKSTKQLLGSKDAKFFLMELDEVDDGAALQDALEDITGQRSVPNIFISQKHVGGNSDLQAIKGKLDGMLKQAGAV